jgi:hypothetical protein
MTAAGLAEIVKFFADEVDVSLRDTVLDAFGVVVLPQGASTA